MALDCVVFPDTGPESVRVLASNALFCRRIYSFLYTNAEFAAVMVEATSKVERGRSFLNDRLHDYFTFVSDTGETLRLLEDEGVLVSLDLEAVAIARSTALAAQQSAIEREIAATGESDIPVSDAKDVLLRDSVRQTDRVFPDVPPGYGDFELMSVYLGRALTEFKDGRTPPGRPLDTELIEGVSQEEVCAAAFRHYLTVVAAFAEGAAAVPSTWSTPLHQAFLACRAVYAKDNPIQDPGVRARESVETTLGRTLLSRELPRVDDLPFEEILEIRRERAPELEAFRTGIAELATTIDLDDTADGLTLQMRDAVSRVVDPALAELRAAVYASRLDIVGRLGRSRVLASATTAALLSACAGAALDASAAVGAATAVALPIVDFAIEERKLRRASQWSLLYRLQRQR
jgi:hypothetical protein